MSMIPQAVLFAAEKHKEQLRKGTDIPYIVHPLGVMEMLIRAGASRDAVVAGILHDTLEDTDTTYEELVEKFGKRVADIVRACSESDKSLPWKKRKEHTIAMLRKCRDKDVLAVIFADKTHNLQSIDLDWQKDKDDVWNRFKHGQDSQMWYYGEICQIARDRYENENVPLKTLMCNYWWEYDSFERELNRWARVWGCGEDREYTPEEEARCVLNAEKMIKELRKTDPFVPKTLLEQYHELAKQRCAHLLSAKDDKIIAKMKKIEARFSNSEWYALIYSSPVFMRPMINEQRKKYIKDK